MKAIPQRPRKIAVVIRGYGKTGGAELFASEVTERLAQNNSFEIHVFANELAPNSDRIRFHKVPIIQFPRFLHQLSFAWFVSLMIKRMKFDLVHSHEWIFNADIFTVHSLPHASWIRNVRKKRYFSLFDRGKIAVEQRAIKTGGSSRFLPVSSIAMEAYRREYRDLPGQWKVLNPGVNVARFSTPDRAECRAEIRGRYGIGESDVLLIFVGMSFGIKGLDTIIEALAKARCILPEANIRLLVVGRGGNEESKFRRVAHSLGVAESVIFAGAQVDELERYYRAADIFIMLSKFDTFGMVVLEAMAASLPVIVSSNVGAKDIVEDGINGFVLPAYQDAEAAAERIIRLSDDARRESMGRAASQTASMHDWEKLAEKMERYYLSTLTMKNALKLNLA